MVNLFLLLSIITLGDTLKSPGKDAWQFYWVANPGAYSKFKLKKLNREIPINKSAHPLKPTAFTGYISIRKNRTSLSLGLFSLSTEASSLFRSAQLDTEEIGFCNFRLIGEHKIWTNKQVIVTPQIGCVCTFWSRYRILTSGKHQKKDEEYKIGLLGGIHLRLQRITKKSRVFPFMEGTYEYCTPFDGVNRVFLKGGMTLVNFVMGGNTEEKRRANRCARMDIALFKGYTWGPFIEAQDHGIGFKIWFLPTPRIWNYEWW